MTTVHAHHPLRPRCRDHCGRAQGPNESREASSEETLPQLLKRSVTDLLKLGSQRPSERHLVQLVPEKPAAGLSATVTSDPAEDPDWPTRLLPRLDAIDPRTRARQG
ncbi:hypothetical protein GN956_G1674 [Arapaima gigas]